MDGWMNGKIYGLMNGEINGWIDDGINGWMEMDVWKDVCMDG